MFILVVRCVETHCGEVYDLLTLDKIIEFRIELDKIEVTYMIKSRSERIEGLPYRLALDREADWAEYDKNIILWIEYGVVIIVAYQFERIFIGIKGDDWLGTDIGRVFVDTPFEEEVQTLSDSEIFCGDSGEHDEALHLLLGGV